LAVAHASRRAPTLLYLLLYGVSGGSSVCGSSHRWRGRRWGLAQLDRPADRV